MSIYTDEDPWEEMICLTRVEGLWKIDMDRPDKVVQIGVSFPEGYVKTFTLLRVEFKERFAWRLAGMLRISKIVIPHLLKIYKNIWSIT